MEILPVLAFPPLSRCPDCYRLRQPGERGCPRCKLSAESFEAILKLHKMYKAACIELIAANETSVAQIILTAPRDP